MRRALLSRVAGREVAALEVRGRLDDLLVETPCAAAPGDVFAARVDRVLAARAGEAPGAFLDGGAHTLFLIDAKGVAPGDRLRVQATRPADPASGKAAGVSRRLEFAGRFMTATPGAPGVNLSKKIQDQPTRDRLGAAVRAGAGAATEAGLGFVIRTRAVGASDVALGEEAARLAALAQEVADAALDPPRRLTPPEPLATRAGRLWDVEPEPAAAETLAAALGAALSPTVRLGPEGGAWLALSRAPGAVVVDVNAGAARDMQAANLAAAAEIPRQLRLRGWGGAVLVDFIGDDPAQRPRIEAALRRAADASWRLAGFGPIGLYEAVKRIDRAPLETLISRRDIEEGS